MSLQTTELTVPSNDISLACSYIAGQASRGIILLLHGIPSVNPPEPGDRGYPGWAEDLAGRGWFAAWADLRAVRRSPGFFSMEGWVRDAIAVIRALRDVAEIRHLPLAVVASSAGGCVAAEAIRRGAPVDAVALLGTPAAWMSFAGDGPAGVRRITEEAGMALAPEVLDDPTSWAAEFETITAEDAIADVKLPTLIVHGTADDIVPVDHAHRIAARAAHAELTILDGAPHILRHEPKAMEILNDWLERTLT